MTTIKISQLPDATTPLTGAEVFPLDQAGITKKVAVSAVTTAVNVKLYGAVGDSTTDDTLAIQSAITAAGVGGTVLFPKGNYKVTSTLQMLVAQAFVGEGGQRASTISKGANGDLINMVSRCTLENLNLDCNGATYTGRGIYISSGVSHVINNVRVTENVTYALEWAANVGSGSKITNFEADMITASADTASIKFGADYANAIPRFLSNIWLPNSLIDFSNSGNGSTIDNFYIRGFITGPAYNACGLIKVSNGRISNPGTTTFTLSDSSFTNIPMGAASLTGCRGVQFANVQFDSLTIDNSSSSAVFGGVDSCLIFDKPRTYTPTWTQSTGTGPTLGDGTLTALVSYSGFKVDYYLRLVMGSTTTYGDSTGAWQFSLPRISSPVANQYIGAAYLRMNSNNYIYVGEISIGAAEMVLTIGYQNGAVRGTFPYAWAAGDTLEFFISYFAP